MLIINFYMYKLFSLTKGKARKGKKDRGERKERKERKEMKGNGMLIENDNECSSTGKGPG